jgi:hypothetical protein
MDHHHQQTIVPVTAISNVQMVGGLPVQKPVPEEYVLADFVLRIIEAGDGRELEFAMKGYLEFLITPVGSSSKCFFMDLLGLASTTVPLLQHFDLDRLIDRVQAAQTRTELLAAVEEVGTVASAIAAVEEVVLRGVVSSPAATSLAHLLTWPLKEHAEAYSMVLPATIDQSDISSNQIAMRDQFELIQRAEKGLPWLIDATRTKTQSILRALESESSQTLSRLDLRLAALRKDISGLESRIKEIPRSERHGPKEIEARDLLKARQSALERDLQRREQVLSDSESMMREFGERVDSVQSELEVARELISACRKNIDAIVVPNVSNLPEEVVRLFVPVVIMGLSKKGRLDIIIYPPSMLVSNVQKLGRRKDFTDSLVPVSDEMAQVVAWCEEQVSKDVTLKKAIRDFSETRNLLVLKNTRNAIMDGARLLLAEGLVKSPALDQIQSLLSGMPEKSFTIEAAPAQGTEVIPGKTSDCTVVLTVHDEQDAPVSQAVFETSDLRVKGNGQGLIRVRLWAGSHRARVSAPNYKDKPVEFSIQPGAETVIPVVLSRVSREEEIEIELDQLIERAEHIDQIRKKLWNAFETQGETLLSIPAYRSSLAELLTDLGYDPELWISQARKKKGMVRRFLKRDDREDALRRDILKIAEESKQSGGIMLLSALLVRLDAMGWITDAKEVSSVIGRMSRDGLIEGLAAIEGGARLVKFVPVGLTDDPQKILGLAAEKDGRLTPEDVVVRLGWTEERVRNALDLLVSNGVAKAQKSYSQSTQYWFPGLRTRPAREQNSERDGTT